MRVSIFGLADGRLLRQFSCREYLEFPTGICAVAERNEIYICDNRAHCVWVFNYDGVMLRVIGHESVMKYPVAVAINQVGLLLPRS